MDLSKIHKNEEQSSHTKIQQESPLESISSSLESALAFAGTFGLLFVPLFLLFFPVTVVVTLMLICTVHAFVFANVLICLRLPASLKINEKRVIGGKINLIELFSKPLLRVFGLSFCSSAVRLLRVPSFSCAKC